MTTEPMDASSEFMANPLRVSCADAVQLITDYLDDALSRSDLEMFETHLSLCEACTVYFDQMKMTIRLTGSAGNDVEVMPANFDALVEELARRAAP